MNTKKLGVAAASLAAIGALVAGGAAVANAADNTATTSTSTSTSSSVPSVGANSGTTGDSGMRGPGGGMGGPGGGMRGPGGGMGGPGGGSQDTPVTGAEADKVIAAVKAKDSAATVTTVRMDPDGSYDALGTKDGAPVMFQVSKDLKTITEAAGGPGGGMGGPGGGSQDTPVTGAEADKVIAAVKAKDSAATVTTVRMDPDGSYDALGTKDGAPVMFEVSKDLKTITERAGGPGGGMGGPRGGGHHEMGAQDGATNTDPQSANGTPSAS